MEERVDFLAQLPIFDELDDSELYDLAVICQAYTFEDGAVITYQRDVAEGLYIVQEGRLYAHDVDERGHINNTIRYRQGDYFGDIWLFVTDAHPATVKAASNGRLLFIRSADFLDFLDKHKSALAKLEPIFDEHSDRVLAGLSREAWDEANKVSFRADKRSAAVSLLADELVEYSSRRSRWFLILHLITPLSGLILIPTILYVFLSGTRLTPLVNLILVGIVFLIFAIWVLFNLLDWSNDYFVITNKHLVHREFSLRTFQTNIIKVPIDQIQSVEIAKPNLVSNVFNIGTARITTAAQAGVVYFDDIDDPIEVKLTLNKLQARVRSLDAGREQAIMRRSLESHFHVPPAYELVKDEGGGKMAVAKEGGLAGLRKRYQARVEERGVITYRKHFFVLLQSISLPLLFTVLVIIVLLTLFTFDLLGLFANVLIAFLLITLDLGWFVWQIEDWRNDTFQITDRYVIDVDRRPFGFGESRKQAELSNVQNVNADRPGLLATIFNYGSVIIDTAGATADIVFENVADPSRVQSDVFTRRDRYQQKQRLAQGEQRRKEYAVLLDVYKQAEEQQRLPRRTYYKDVDES